MDNKELNLIKSMNNIFKPEVTKDLTGRLGKINKEIEQSRNTGTVAAASTEPITYEQLQEAAAKIDEINKRYIKGIIFGCKVIINSAYPKDYWTLDSKHIFQCSQDIYDKIKDSLPAMQRFCKERR